MSSSATSPSGFLVSWGGNHSLPEPLKSEADFRLLDQAAFEEPYRSGGARMTHTTRTYESGTLRVTCHERAAADLRVREVWAIAEAATPESVLIRRFESFRIPLAPSRTTLRWFTSGWGREFEPVRVVLESPLTLDSRHGRSSAAIHPWFFVSEGDGPGTGIAIAWSGNWVARFSPDPGVASGGINEWEFSRVVGPGDHLEGAHAILADGDDLDDVSRRFVAWGRAGWCPGGVVAKALPVEWNHWWPYEDKEIDETTFRANAAAAAEMGMEAATLDAGWFGSPGGSTHWFEERGDWDKVNTTRFPAGLRDLAERTRGAGLRFGIWCEIEGLGVKAELRTKSPRLEALRDGQRVGTVCFGCPDTRSWALATLERLIVELGAGWIKLDFNVNPGAGCNRTDHGHQAGDGLYEHCRGYYAVLDEVRRRHPEVILENCASGGQRIDLGLAGHTDAAFLSDIDETVHGLQIFWGATLMLPPERCLRWPWSQTRTDAGGRTPYDGLQLAGRDAGIEEWRLAYHVRAAMLGWLGFSHKLAEVDERLRRLIAGHVACYKETVRQYVREGVMYRLTAQPLRGGRGDRWCAFQYVLPGAARALVFVFRLPGAEAARTLRLRGLVPDATYRIADLDGGAGSGAGRSATGLTLADGLLLEGLREEESRLLELARG